MIAERATCGHFAVFSIDGQVLNRSCTCPNVFLPGTPAALTVADLPIASRRKTSNSRGPRQEGTVYLAPGVLSRCPKCKGVRVGNGPRAPRNMNGKRVDCAGKEIA